MATSKAPKNTPKSTPKTRHRRPATPAAWKRVARPDPPDARDRPFQPNVGITPRASLFPKQLLPVKHQGDTNACTGFGLSVVVEHLLRSSGRERAARISPFMLYFMARRYDEFPGSARDEGSSARGAMKGWFKHGACGFDLFPTLDAPPAQPRIQDDWWYDAVTRPLGAYYRVDPQNITDLHAALNEVGALFVTSGCHAGWDEGNDLNRPQPRSMDAVWEIPRRGGQAAHEAHAYALVGYDRRGFLLQNSWGEGWGSGGFARLTYDDWLVNAMDCWVAQLGVVTAEHEALSRSVTLRQQGRNGPVQLAASRVLRDREIAPFVVNMGNNGQLSNSGDFRTTPDDVRALVDVHLAEARKRWKPADGIVDVCIYVHGGLVGERAAAETAACWIPHLYDAQVFPVFMMWECDFLSTVIDRLEDALLGVPRAAGRGSAFERWWNRRLEQALARPGSTLWGEMKQNAQAISALDEQRPIEQQAGGQQLWHHFKHHAADRRVRMHFVGHSAGSIAIAWMIDRLVRSEGLQVASASFLAPALRVDTFQARVLPHLASGAIGRYQQFHLTAGAEEDDPSCGPYRRSLLHLVSESFEGGVKVPLLGLQTDFDTLLAHQTLPRTTGHVAPGPHSGSTQHGDFDQDEATMAAVLAFIRNA